MRSGALAPYVRMASGFRPRPVLPRLIAALLHGDGVRDAARHVGCHRNTAMRVRRAMVALLGRDLRCVCGRSSAHPGTCWSRRLIARADEIAELLVLPRDAVAPGRVRALRLSGRYAHAVSDAGESVETVEARLDVQRLVAALSPRDRARVLSWIGRGGGSLASIRDVVVQLRAQVTG